jgi:hypothetical protein
LSLGWHKFPAVALSWSLPLLPETLGALCPPYFHRPQKLDINFNVKVPGAQSSQGGGQPAEDSKVQLSGLRTWDAAFWCASHAAAERRQARGAAPAGAAALLPAGAVLESAPAQPRPALKAVEQAPLLSRVANLFGW